MDKKVDAVGEEGFLNETQGKDIYAEDAPDADEGSDGTDGGEDPDVGTDGDGGHDAEGAPEGDDDGDAEGEDAGADGKEAVPPKEGEVTDTLGEQRKKLVPEAPVSLLPAHFSAEGKQAFDKLISGKADPKEAQALMVTLAKEVQTTERNRSAIIDRHVGELVKMKQLASDPSRAAALQYMDQNPDVQEAVAQLLTEHQRAKQAGVQDPLGHARQVLGGAAVPKAEEVFSRIDQLSAMTPEEQQDALLSNPETIRDLFSAIKGLREETRAAQGKVSEALQPIHAVSEQAKNQQHHLEVFQGLVKGLPEEWKTSPEIINRLDAILAADGPAWVSQGKTPEQVFEKAVDRLEGVLSAQKAREQGAQAEKEKTTTARLKRMGVHGDAGAPRKKGEPEPWDQQDNGKDVYD